MAGVNPPKIAVARLNASEKPQVLTSKGMISVKNGTIAPLLDGKISPSVSFSVESRGRKRKGVSEFHDPSGGRREETPDVTIPRWKTSTPGINRTNLATS